MQDYSFGIIPLKYNHSSKEWDVLLVLHQSGYWAFPKGHADPGESPQETAARELKEETGLSIDRFISDEALKENYSFFIRKKQIFKTVLYFLASVNGDVVIQETEISASCWLPLRLAAGRVTFPEGKHLCSKALHLIKGHLG
jgi:bis(5'-nucleosidyl)-tetraphosphatase